MNHSRPYLAPPDVGLDVLHVDESLLIVNKPSGLLSVPGRGAGKDDCLVSRVQAVYPDALSVHRLDMETSGLIVLARSKEMHRCLSILFQDRLVEKSYVAVIDVQWHKRVAKSTCHSLPTGPTARCRKLITRSANRRSPVIAYSPAMPPTTAREWHWSLKPAARTSCAYT